MSSLNMHPGHDCKIYCATPALSSSPFLRARPAFSHDFPIIDTEAHLINDGEFEFVTFAIR